LIGEPSFAADSRSAMQSPWAAALVVAATVALYWPSLSAGFVGDDFMILHRLRGIHGADVTTYVGRRTPGLRPPADAGAGTSS